MKIRVLVMLVLILCLLFFSLSCKKDEEIYKIYRGSGTISYNISLDETFFEIEFGVTSTNNVDARITSWKLVFKSGETQLLEINSDNYQNYAPFLNCPDIMHFDAGEFTLGSVDPGDLANSQPCQGKVFPAAAPDYMYVSVTLTDTNGKVETAEQRLPAYYSSHQ
ncbi:MAG: hypothetical protein NTZ12_08195 [Candidatus Aminicenantes bacterium]|nr:hypothetical protein [Candidatus Aminicenantes bacterium]